MPNKNDVHVAQQGDKWAVKEEGSRAGHLSPHAVGRDRRWPSAGETQSVGTPRSRQGRQDQRADHVWAGPAPLEGLRSAAGRLHKVSARLVRCTG